MIGQYADETVADPVPVYTKNIAHNGINRLGLNLSTTKINGMAYDDVNFRLFVSDTGNNRVLVYNADEDGNLLDRIPDYVLGQSNFYTNSSGATSSTLNSPSGLTYDFDFNKLLVADNGNNRVLVYDAQVITNGEAAESVLGQPDFTTVSAGTTIAKLSAPQGIVYHSSTGELFIADTGNNRVLIFQINTITNGENAVNVLGQTDFTSSAAATTREGMNTPVDVTFVSETLFVSDSGNNRVTISSISGGITDGQQADKVFGQATFTSNTAANTQAGMSSPTALAVRSASNKLFVAQSGNNRVTVFDLGSITNGKNAESVLGQANFTATSAAVTQAGMSNPRGMVQVDGGTRDLYVLEAGANRIKEYEIVPIVDGEDAVDLIGQYTDETLSTLVPVYTKSAAHNAPNKLGLAGNASLVDSKNHRLFISDTGSSRMVFK
jgi:DNA-binding beta-propeller fold protein YncE